MDDSTGDEHLSGPWVDNHCHLELERGTDGAYAAMGRGPSPEDRTAVLLDEARSAGVVAMITVGTDAASSRRCIEMAAAHEGVWATAGVHPHDAKNGTAELRAVVGDARDAAVDDVASNGALVAIGECGLDFHYDHSPRHVQRRVFAEQVRMANELDLPLVIHTRDAWEETFEILDVETVPARTVFHCFTGGPGEAERCVERGALVSVSGIVTFPSAGELREAVQRTPLSHLMVETDSPYLTPVPHRGRPNSPALVGLVGREVARLHDVPVGAVARATSATAAGFYRIDAG